MIVRFNGRSPQPRDFQIANQGNNNVDRVQFQLPAFEGAAAFLHLKIGNYTDIVQLVDGSFTATRTHTQRAGRIEAWIEILADGDVVWRSDVFGMRVGHIPDDGEQIEQAYPTAIEDALRAVDVLTGVDARAETLPAGSDATVSFEEDETGNRTIVYGIPRGQDGNGSGGGNGEPGEDGGYYVPSVSAAGDLTWAPSKADMPAVETINIKGPQGDTGAIGPQGPQGAQGAKGDKGDKGDTGAQGPQGVQGPAGAQGAQGPQGPKGETGPAGADGAKGDKGDTGDPGPQGIQGVQGVQGERGPQGLQGDKGETGAAGKDGVSATHAWSGTTLTITSASGTSSADLKGDKGDKGDTGAKGETGATGPQGEAGPQGPKGDKGDPGEVTTESITSALGYTPADAEKVNELSEEIEEIKSDVSSYVEETGDYITGDFGADVAVDVMTVQNHQYLGSGYNATVVLNHIRGCNMFNFVDIFGGVGISTQNGVTFEIRVDGTAKLSGTATALTTFKQVNLFYPTGKIVPAGTYAIGNSLTLAFNKLDATTTLIKKQTGGTVVLDEPAVITQAYVYVSTGATVDELVQLALVRGTKVPSAGLAYDGDTYSLRRENFLTENGCVIDWKNGIVTYSDGTTFDRFDAVEFDCRQGTNTFFTANGITTIRYEKNKTSYAPFVDHKQWGLPVLRLYGDTSAMTKDVSVSLEYVCDKGVGTCEVKWQGSSSLSYPKKNYTIKFDDAFEAKEGWGEQKKYCFKANFIDHSHARNVVSCILWGQIVKSRATPNETLNALPNGGAIDGFPCIIMLNDEFHGLYTWNIPKDGWMFGMGSGENEAIVCADGYSPGTTFTGEATLNGDFDLEYVSDEENQDWLLPSLNRLINAVATSDGSDLDTTIAQYLDWDSAIDYYIYNVLEQGADAMDKNYLLATYDGVKWFFSAYDRDTTYGLEWHGKSFEKAGSQVRFQDFAGRNRVMLLIRDYKRDELKARYEELRSTILSEDNVANVFCNFIAGIPSPLYMADVEKWQGIPSSAVSNLSQILNWYRLRVAVIDAEMNAL